MKPAESRVAAIVLLVVAVAIGYFALVHWWFVAPQLAIAYQRNEMPALMPGIGRENGK